MARGKWRAMRLYIDYAKMQDDFAICNFLRYYFTQYIFRLRYKNTCFAYFYRIALQFILGAFHWIFFAARRKYCLLDGISKALEMDLARRPRSFTPLGDFRPCADFCFGRGAYSTLICGGFAAAPVMLIYLLLF